ncbi:MAG TPA: Hpt domain-containing protein [Burkholderiales bacterium]|nr:Hpt domain-containing protein [Burkholderiales bacterium]
MSDADDLAAELAALTAEYRQKLAARLDALEALAEQRSPGQQGAALVEDLYRALHTIAGSAKTFGLPAVSDAARAGERYLEPICGANEPLSAAQWDDLKVLLASLRKAAGSA